MGFRNLVITALFIVLPCLAMACDDSATCDVHEDCAPDEVCRFGQESVCLQRCSDDDNCPLGSECNSCAASSCPACDDCISACVSRF